MYSAVTRNIAVSVVPFYLEEHSDPAEAAMSGAIA